MRDKRPVDELSIEELERILAIRKREERQARATRSGRYEARRVPVPPPVESAEEPVLVSEPQFPPGMPQTPPVVESPAQSTIPPVDADSDPQFEDELDYPRHAVPAGRSVRVIWWNRGLTVVEIGAVVGLVYLLITLFVSLQAVTQTTANIQADYQATIQAQQIPPTETPVIDVASVVLPGGHTFDPATNSGQFNIGEIPVQYRAAFQSQLQLPTPVAQPTLSPEEALSIRIPALNIQAAVVSGDNWDDLQHGVGHHVGSADPGQLGNDVLAGHDDIYGSIFKDLAQLKAGDEVILTTATTSYTYVVQTHQIVEPTDTSVMDNSRRDIAQLTLITCYPYQVDTRRYVVYAILKT